MPSPSRCIILQQSAQAGLRAAGCDEAFGGWCGKTDHGD
jgi:hypothetical protein